jgi:hypothetical protein
MVLMNATEHAKIVDEVFSIQGDWISIMIGDVEEREAAWEDFVEEVMAMSDEELLAAHAQALELKSRM